MATEDTPAPAEAMVYEPRAELLADLRTAVLEDFNSAIHEVEDARHQAESQGEKVFLVVDVVVLPFAVGLMVLVQALHMPAIVAPATFVPNLAYMLVRSWQKLRQRWQRAPAVFDQDLT
jgi:hypothetical protein